MQKRKRQYLLCSREEIEASLASESRKEEFIHSTEEKRNRSL